MEEYYFLFFLGLIWTVFAVVQDMKTREVANWLTYSLIGFALAYRAFYSSFSGDWMFLGYGLLGFGFFYVLAHAFYYTKVFAGADAKLLMGYGILLPYYSYFSVVLVGLGFVFILFLIGAFWSMIYGVWIARENWGKFKKEFWINVNKFGLSILGLVVLVGILSLVWLSGLKGWSFGILILGLLWIYVKSLDKCMTKNLSPGKLREGDWLENDVRVGGGRIVKKSVHGLSLGEIRLLKKRGRKVLIKEGVPFTPAFLIALVFMGYVFLILEGAPFSFLGF